MVTLSMTGCCENKKKEFMHIFWPSDTESESEQDSNDSLNSSNSTIALEGVERKSPNRMNVRFPTMLKNAEEKASSKGGAEPNLTDNISISISLNSSLNSSTLIEVASSNSTPDMEQVLDVHTVSKSLDKNSMMPASDPVFLMSAQTPRQYQEEIFEKAKFRNVIAVLDTGSGKTLISLMLLKYVHSIEPDLPPLQDTSSNALIEPVVSPDEPGSKSVVSAKKRISIFLVPTIPLVSQQGQYLSSNSLLRVGQVWGGSENISIDIKKWQLMFDHFDVIVMTPLILLHALDRGYVMMKHFNLLIFDECHHARQSHPYSLIMKIHYNACDASSRPKIFGMTASPIAAKEETDISIEQLENILASAAISSSPSLLRKFISTPKERLVTYPPSDFFTPPPLYFRIASDFPSLASYMDAEIVEAMSFCDSLGPWASERALELAVEDFSFFIRRKIIRLTKMEEKAALAFTNSAETATEDQSLLTETDKPVPKEVTWNNSFSSFEEQGVREKLSALDALNEPSRQVEIQGLIFRPPKAELGFMANMSLNDCKAILDECEKLVSDAPYWGKTAPAPSSSDIGPKIKALVLLLLECKTEASGPFCGIIFCKQRLVTRVLEILLKNHPHLQFLKTACLVGHGGRSKGRPSFSRTGGAGMNVMEQQQIVQQFKDGTLNLLVATSVAEEGLDIRPCNCVIRFDICDMNLVSYLQSRGRARHQSSQFIFLAEENDPSAALLMEHLKHSESGMRATIQARESDSNDEDMDKDTYFGSDIDPASVYRVPATGAFVTMHNATLLLNSFCASLPRDRYYEPKPDYLIAESYFGYTALLLMPRCFRHGNEYSAIKSDTDLNRKAAAKKDAAFKMVKVLHQEGELDDHLRPSWLSSDSSHIFASLKSTRSTRKKGVMQEHFPPLERKQVRSHAVEVPSPFRGVFEPAVPLFLNLIKIEFAGDSEARYLTVGFFSFQKPPFNASNFSFEINNVPCNVSVVTASQVFSPSACALGLFRKFHFEFFNAILRSNFDESTPWATLCVPLVCNADDSVNFDHSISPDDMIDWEALEFCQSGDLTDKSFLSDPFIDYSQVCDFVLFDKYRYRRNYILTELLSDVTPQTNMEIGAGRSFDCIADFYKGRLECDQEIDPEQLLVRAIPLGYPFHSTKPPVKFQEVLLIPQFCTVCPIKRRHLEAVLQYPILLRQITHRMLMHDVLDGTSFPDSPVKLDLSLDLLSEAFTAPSAALSTNYERLETLGDSFLKIQLTLHLFVQHPSRHEGFLTNARMRLENNTFLRQTANQLKLEPLILSNPFSRQHYIPPTLEGQIEQLISDKTVADVVEAVIGASLIDGGISNATTSIRFFLGTDFLNWEDYQSAWSQYLPPATPATPVDSGMVQACSYVSNRIDYTFQNINLLVEALTHSSAITGGASYERLEFLGDAILGFAVTHKIFEFSNLTPGAITDLRRELVSNQFLGCISCSLGFPLLLNHMSSVLSVAMKGWISEFVLKFGSSTEAMKEAIEAGVPLVDEEVLLFWNRMEPSPKVMGDIYEAILGAVFVDCGFRIEPVNRVLETTMFTPWWPRFNSLMKVDEGLQTKHPMRVLADLIHTIKCRQFISESEKHLNGMNECRFLLHGTVIATAECESKKSARKNAAFKAVEFLESQIDAIEDLCDCASPQTCLEEVNECIVPAKRKWLG